MDTRLAKQTTGPSKIFDQGEVAARVREYIADSIAENTRRAYASDFRSFAAWCAAAGVVDIPADPTTAATYFTHLADVGKKASTIDRARAAIRKAHEAAEFADPTSHKHVKQVLKGIRRRLGTAKTKKAPVLTDDVRAMAMSLPDSTAGVRDRALLLVGFAGAFRRSELVGISAEDIEETAEGVKILLPKSKTDQEGQGRIVGIKRGCTPNTCPVRALAAWCETAGVVAGPIFRSIDRHGRIGNPLTAQAVALIVKRAAAAAGLDSAKYSGHSLRAGFVTQGAINGATEVNIMRSTGHKSFETVRGYVRIANIFKDNVSGQLGL